MSKKKKILIGVGILLLALIVFFAFRYFRRKEEEEGILEPEAEPEKVPEAEPEKECNCKPYLGINKVMKPPVKTTVMKPPVKTTVMKPPVKTTVIKPPVKPTIGQPPIGKYAKPKGEGDCYKISKDIFILTDEVFSTRHPNSIDISKTKRYCWTNLEDEFKERFGMLPLAYLQRQKLPRGFSGKFNTARAWAYVLGLKYFKDINSNTFNVLTGQY